MRVRPIDIDVPEDDPFANDRLDRRDQAQAIAAILTKVEGPFVLAVDAPWGEGKTTFLRIGQAYLRKQGFLVVGFNAWETDFCDDPFIALTTEVIQALETFSIDGVRSGSVTEAARNEIAEALKPLRKRSRSFISWRTVSLGAKFIVQSKTGIDPSSLIEALSPEDENLAESKIKAYEEQKRLMRSFTEALTRVGTLTKETTGHPLVISIDELDRCRPTYAIELLETVRHLFCVDDVVFVLGINRVELAHSVRAVYGERFDADKYLSRFIDIDVNLPRPDTTMVIDQFIKSCELEQALQINIASMRSSDYGDTLGIAKRFLASSELSIREIGQSIHHLGLVITSLPLSYHPLLPMTMVLLVLRSIERRLYNRFSQGEATDFDVVTSLFDRPGLSRLRWTYDAAYIEAYITLAHREILHGDFFRIEDNTLLMEKYEEMIDEGTQNTTDIKNHVSRLKGLIKDIRSNIHYTQHGNNARVVISRIELFADPVPR